MLNASNANSTNNVESLLVRWTNLLKYNPSKSDSSGHELMRNEQMNTEDQYN